MSKDFIKPGYQFYADEIKTEHAFNTKCKQDFPDPLLYRYHAHRRSELKVDLGSTTVRYPNTITAPCHTTSRL